MNFLTNRRLFCSPVENLIETLQQDIASLASLEIRFDHNDFLDTGWTTLYQLGVSLQNSSTLKELVLSERWASSTFTDPEVVENAKEFLKCVSHNRVLNKLIVDWDFGRNGTAELGFILKSFISDNTNLHYLGNGKFTSNYLNWTGDHGLNVSLMLRSSPLTSLDFRFGQCSKEFAQVLQLFFSKYPQHVPNQLSFSLTTNFHDFIECGKFFGGLLQLEQLEEVAIVDKEWDDIYSISISNTKAWNEVFESILMRNSPLVSLSLIKYQLNDNIVTMMAHVLKKDHTKIPLELCLSDNSIRDYGAKSLAEMLLVMELPMKCLDLSGNEIGVGGMSAILKVFNEHPNLLPKTFSIAKNKFVCSEWSYFGSAMSRGTSPIMSYDMSEHHTSERFDQSLSFSRFIDYFMHKWHLFPKRIVMNQVVHIPLICNLLQQESSLEYLKWDCRVGLKEEDTIPFLNALKGNKTLKELDLHRSTPFTDKMASLVADLLGCLNGEQETHDSNCTLSYYFPYYSNEERISDCLHLNSLTDKNKCKKLKVIKYHFANNFSISKYKKFDGNVLVELLCFLHKWMPLYVGYEIDHNATDYVEKMIHYEEPQELDLGEFNLFNITYMILKGAIVSKLEMGKKKTHMTKKRKLLGET